MLFIALGCGMSTAAAEGGRGGAIPMGGGGSPGGSGGPPIEGGGGKLTGNGGGGGGGGGGVLKISIGSLVKQSSFKSYSYPCAATRANAALHALSIATSLFLPRPQERDWPLMTMAKTQGEEGVAPRPGGWRSVKDASDMRWVLV